MTISTYIAKILGFKFIINHLKIGRKNACDLPYFSFVQPLFEMIDTIC